MSWEGWMKKHALRMKERAVRLVRVASAGLGSWTVRQKNENGGCNLVYTPLPHGRK